MKQLLFLSIIIFSCLSLNSQVATLAKQNEEIAATRANSVVAGNVGGYTSKIHYTIPTSTVSYSIGDNVGGDISIESLRRSSGKNYIIYEVALFDADGQTPNMTIDFVQSPVTPNTDNTATQLTGDMDKYLGTLSISASDWTVTGSISRCSIKYVGVIIQGSLLRAIITTKTAVNYTTVGGLNMKIGVIQD